MSRHLLEGRSQGHSATEAKAVFRVVDKENLDVKTSRVEISKKGDGYKRSKG